MPSRPLGHVDQRALVVGHALADAVEAGVVGAALEHGVARVDPVADRLDQARDVALDQLVLEGQRGRRDHDPAVVEQARDEVAQRLAGAGAGLDEEVLAALHRRRPRPRPSPPGPGAPARRGPRPPPRGPHRRSRRGQRRPRRSRSGRSGAPAHPNRARRRCCDLCASIEGLWTADGQQSGRGNGSGRDHTSTRPHVAAHVEVTPAVRAQAALALFDSHAFAIHFSAARVHGVPVPTHPDEHVTVTETRHRRRPQARRTPRPSGAGGHRRRRSTGLHTGADVRRARLVAQPRRPRGGRRPPRPAREGVAAPARPGLRAERRAWRPGGPPRRRPRPRARRLPHGDPAEDDDRPGRPARAAGEPVPARRRRPPPPPIRPLLAVDTRDRGVRRPPAHRARTELGGGPGEARARPDRAARVASAPGPPSVRSAQPPRPPRTGRSRTAHVVRPRRAPAARGARGH